MFDNTVKPRVSKKWNCSRHEWCRYYMDGEICDDCGKSGGLSVEEIEKRDGCISKYL